MNTTVDEQRKIELAKLDCEIRRELATVKRLYDEHVAASKRLDIARAKHKRLTLWQQADELRTKLAQVEDEAAKITL